MIIDFHTHVFPPQIKADRRCYLEKDACFAELYSNERSCLATASELIAGMDEAGVDVSVITNIGWSSRELCAATNDYMMESVTLYKGRLIGFGSVNPFAEWACEEIGRCGRGGLKGIGELRPDAGWLDAAKSDALARFAVSLKEHNLILLLHSTEPVGHMYPGKGGATPQVLYRLIERFAGVKIVLAHWGGGLPFYALMPQVKTALEKVWFDSAASPFLYGKKIYELAASLVGENKILFGSDYPLIPQRRIINEVETLDLPKAAKDLFLGGNAAGLLGV